MASSSADAAASPQNHSKKCAGILPAVDSAVDSPIDVISSGGASALRGASLLCTSDSCPSSCGLSSTDPSSCGFSSAGAVVATDGGVTDLFCGSEAVTVAVADTVCTVGAL